METPVFETEDRGCFLSVARLLVVILALGISADQIGGMKGQHEAGGDHHRYILLINIYRQECRICLSAAFSFATGEIVSRQGQTVNSAFCRFL